MSHDNDALIIGEAIKRLYFDANAQLPISSERPIAPVPLDRLIASYNLVHEQVPSLTSAAAAAFLARWGIERPELRHDASPLAGFLFANAHGGYILVNAEDTLPRRRFTAAHELGHYLLHFLPRLQREDSESYLLQSDAGDMVREEEKATEDKTIPLPEMERQANRFAAELLMPVGVCLAASKHSISSRFVEHLLARDLLVSRAAMRWRLRSLPLSN